MHVKVVSPKGKALHDEDDAEEGELSFVAESTGNYVFCFTNAFEVRLIGYYARRLCGIAALRCVARVADWHRGLICQDDDDCSVCLERCVGRFTIRERDAGLVTIWGCSAGRTVTFPEKRA